MEAGGSFITPSALLKPTGTLFFFLSLKKNLSFKIFFFSVNASPELTPLASLQLDTIFACSLPSRASISWRGAATLVWCPGFLTSGDPVFTAVAQGAPPPLPGSGGGVSSWGPGGCNNQISGYLWHTSTPPPGLQTVDWNLPPLSVERRLFSWPDAVAWGAGTLQGPFWRS